MATLCHQSLSYDSSLRYLAFYEKNSYFAFIGDLRIRNFVRILFNKYKLTMQLILKCQKQSWFTNKINLRLKLNTFGIQMFQLKWFSILGNKLHIGQKSYTIKELKIAQLEREIGGEPNIGESVVEAESSASQIWSQPSSNREKHKVKNQPIKTSARLAGIQRGRIDSA
ncbi:hypothetical protein HHI36_019991 [Cryptolaemus montrouzieri]|uniref:Uncharacterized protein n=1 Tax=Cryptolaemus montrouzieri TaxID=559131 RepID=A0ABD2N991_9CUCU